MRYEIKWIERSTPQRWEPNVYEIREVESNRLIVETFEHSTALLACRELNNECAKLHARIGELENENRAYRDQCDELKDRFKFIDHNEI